VSANWAAWVVVALFGAALAVVVVLACRRTR
jgi:hypothetical protein